MKKRRRVSSALFRALAGAWSPEPGAFSLPSVLPGLDDDLDAPVVRTALGRLVVRDRAIRTDADRLDAVRSNAAGDELAAHGLGALVREVHVVLALALRVGVTLDRDVRVGVALD